MLIVRNKTEKIKMASYLEAVMEHFEVVIFESQSDLASSRDHKNMLLSEFLNGKGVFCMQQVLANLCFSASVFLNFAKGMICNCNKSFAVVVPREGTSISGGRGGGAWTWHRV